jgi:hypothetical protein
VDPRGLLLRLGQEVAAALLDQIRLELKTQVPDLARRGRIMKDLSGPATYEAFIARGENALRDRLSVLLK